MKQKITCIYCILNVITGDKYIGSSIDFEERWRRHKRDLKRNKHHSIILQRAFNKYGIDSFKHEIIEYCSKEEMKEKENFYLKKHNPKYNICKEAYTTIGRFYSENTRKKHIKWAKENDIKPPKETYESKMIKVSMISIKTGEILEKFKSLSDACRFLNKTINFSSTIKLACIGKRKTALGYKWEITKEK